MTSKTFYTALTCEFVRLCLLSPMWTISSFLITANFSSYCCNKQVVLLCLIRIKLTSDFLENNTYFKIPAHCPFHSKSNEFLIKLRENQVHSLIYGVPKNETKVLFSGNT